MQKQNKELKYSKKYAARTLLKHIFSLDDCLQISVLFAFDEKTTTTRVFSPLFKFFLRIKDKIHLASMIQAPTDRSTWN